MQSSENQPPPAQEAAKPDGAPAVPRSAWAVPVMWMVIVLILAGAGVYVFKSCRDLPGDALGKATQLAGKVGATLQQVAAAFKQGTITTTFTSYATSLSGSQYFQFATLAQHEIFTQTNESSLAYGYIPLPDVIVEARAPVFYTYYLDLNDKWEFILRDGAILVVAPDIKFNRPSVDVSRITWEVKKDSYFRRTSEAMESLKSSITWLSYKKAQSNIELVRDKGRKETETFVQNWLARSFADGKSYPVKVLFRSETKTNGVLQRPKAG